MAILFRLSRLSQLKCLNLTACMYKECCTDWDAVECLSLTILHTIMVHMGITKAMHKQLD